MLNYTNKVFTAIVIIILSVTALTSCKARKVKAITGVKNDTASTAEILVKNVSRNWQYFSSKADVSYKSGSDEQNVGANIRMYKDSLIWLSANLFGIEGARILVNKDSVIVMDKLHGTYRVYGKEILTPYAGGPVDIGELQNIMLGNPLFVATLYKFLIGNMQGNIVARKGNVEASHTISSTLNKVENTSLMQISGGQKVSVKYADFTNLDGSNFPAKITLESSDFKQPLKIVIEYKSPDFNTVPTFPFTIPNSYERK